MYTFISNILYMNQGSASLNEVCGSLVVWTSEVWVFFFNKFLL